MDSQDTKDGFTHEVVKRRRGVWAGLAVVLALLGVVGSVTAAQAIAREDAQSSHQSFVVASAQVASIVRLAIQHEQDLVVSAAGFAITNPHSSEAGFVRWAKSVRALERYPEVTGFGESVIVPASQLAAFAARAVGSSTWPLGPGGAFKVIPPGSRSFYCFSKLEQVRTASAGMSAGVDYCAGDQGAAALASRDSGVGTYFPIKLGTVTSLAIETPVYRGGSVPASVAARRAAFVGWIGMSVLPGVLLNTALENHPRTAVSLRYGDFGSDVAFHAGSAPANAQHAVVNLHNGWTVDTSAAGAGAGLLANGRALAFLVVGVASSLLLGLLMFVLGTSRARALALVSKKTDDLRYLALHDPLTDLANRTLIVDRIQHLLARTRRGGASLGVMYVDLDDFKNVNDTLGHAAGDELLIAVATRLGATLRDADTIGRMGGDEFVVLVEGGVSQTAPELVAERLLDVMRQPFTLKAAPQPLTVSISIGIAVGERSSPGDLLRDADIALYLSKTGGKNRFEVFRPEQDGKIKQRYELEFDLRRALEHDEFRLVYQPIYTLDDLSLVGVEALLRWQHPALGLIQPGEFIPLLEANGQIVEVGRWVLDAACKQMAAWHAEGSTLGLSVNVSGRQLDHDGVVADVRHALELSGLDPAALTIEVTETTLMRNTQTAARELAELKALGIQLAIDDFGTGYSSLAYLQKFSVDCLKIDRSFINAISKSSESKALVRTLVQLGRDLGLKIVAEGVETTEQVDHLRGESVDQIQGFLLAKPLDPETFGATILHLAPTVAQSGR